MSFSRTSFRLRSSGARLVTASVAAGFGVLTGSAVPLQSERALAATAMVQRGSLVMATSGAASIEVKAVGEQAKLLNAELPFDSAAIAAAQPFIFDRGEVERNRAFLCLSQAVYYEAGFEPVAGRRAVAQVVLNRVRHPAYPDSVCGVVYQVSRDRVCQFTFVCDGSLDRAPEPGAWRQARAIAAAALAGYVERSVGMATHYHADYVAPRWAPLLTKLTQIGAHIFYRWPNAWGQPRAFVARYAGEPRDPIFLRPAMAKLVPGKAANLATIADVLPAPSRAPNDVGGLLDTSKGWTLSIPDPREVGSGASQVIAQQTQTVPRVAIASAAVPGAAGR